jgi:hypothetical protein
VGAVKRAVIVAVAVAVVIILVIGFQAVPSPGQGDAEAKVRRALGKCEDPPAPQERLERSVECTAQGNTWECTYAGSDTLVSFDEDASQADVNQALAC